MKTNILQSLIHQQTYIIREFEWDVQAYKKMLKNADTMPWTGSSSSRIALRREYARLLKEYKEGLAKAVKIQKALRKELCTTYWVRSMLPYDNQDLMGIMTRVEPYEPA